MINMVFMPYLLNIIGVDNGIVRMLNMRLLL